MPPRPVPTQTSAPASAMTERSDASVAWIGFSPTTTSSGAPSMVGDDEWHRLFLFGPGGDDLRRVRRDPAEHHCRPRPRPAPAPMTGHHLLEGKVVVITATAGTGIGGAAARRCLEEGARSRSATSTPGGWPPPGTSWPPPTATGSGPALRRHPGGAGRRADRGRGRALRPHRRADQQRRAGRHRLRARHDRRAVAAGARRHSAYEGRGSHPAAPRSTASTWPLSISGANELRPSRSTARRIPGRFETPCGTFLRLPRFRG